MSVISLGALVSVSFFAYMSNNKEHGGIGGIVTISENLFLAPGVNRTETVYQVVITFVVSLR